MLLERMAHIKKDSWHYKMVVFWHRIMREKLEIKSLWEYWFCHVPLLILMTLIFGAFGLFLVFGVGLILYEMAAALIAHPAHALWVGITFIGSVMGGVIAILAVSAIIGLIATKIGKHTPDVEID